MPQPQVEPAATTHHRELERRAHMERVTAELRALARDEGSPAARRPVLGEAMRAWERDVAAARRRLHATRGARSPSPGGGAADRPWA
jgi:hypothetical protein